MKAEDIEIIEEYTRKDGHRDWAQRASTWLLPGDIICIISGETAVEIKQLVDENNKAIKERNPSA
jgi:hypothetical protein